MYFGKVIGNLVSIIKHQDYHGLKLLIVQPVHPKGTSSGDPLICIDIVDAGIGQTVLYVDEGNSARQLLNLGSDAPVRPVIVGVVDDIQWQDEEGQPHQRMPLQEP